MEVIENGLRTIGCIILLPLYIIGLPLTIIKDIIVYRKNKQKNKREASSS